MSIIQLLPQFFVLFLFCISMGMAGEASNLRIIQTATNGQHVTAYFDVRDDNDQVIELIDISQLKVTVGEHDIKQIETGFGGQNTVGSAYIFLIDISRSLTDNEFTEIQKGLKDWINSLDSTNSVALITFGANVEAIQTFTNEYSKVNDVIDKLRRTDDYTRLNDGLIEALNMGPMHLIDGQIPNRRVIITLSDGINEVQNNGGATREEVIAAIKKNQLPIYAIGFAGRSVNKQEQAGLRNLEELARVSDGEYVQAQSAVELEAVYITLQKKINETFFVHFECENCPQDNKDSRLQIQFSENGRTVKDDINIRLSPNGTILLSTCENTWCTITQSMKNSWIFFLVGLSVLLFLAGIIYLLRRKKKNGMDNTDDPVSPILGSIDETRQQNNVYKLNFTVVSGIKRGREYQLDFEGSAVVGRTPGADLAIDEDLKISKRHCKIERKGGKFLISDLESKHGTFLNGVTLFGQRILEEGDLISIGQTEMRFDNQGKVF